jgi:hypothetical protein
MHVAGVRVPVLESKAQAPIGVKGSCGAPMISRVFLTVRPCKPLKVMYVRGGQTCFGEFWGKTLFRHAIAR